MNLDDFSAVSEELLQWCQKHGIIASKIGARLVGDGWRGVVATHEIEKNHCILRVPRKLLICGDSAARDRRLMESCTQNGLTSVQILMVHLLSEMAKGDASFWWPYLQSLPPSYTTAICFSPEALEALQVGYAQQQAEAALEQALKQWEQALPVLRALLPPKWRSRQAWLWAASTLSSRTMFMPDDEAGALTPLGDLHNFGNAPPPFTPQLRRRASDNAGLPEIELCGDGHLVEDAEEYRIHVRRRYRAGEQIFLCYGRHTNLELLLHYGFVLPNPHDVALLPPHLLPQAVMDQLDAVAAVVHANGNPSWELLRALRLAGATPAERRTSAYLAVERDEAISVASERAALTTLRGACVAALSALPSTLEVDALLLEGSGLSPCIRVSVEWRLGYKRVLSTAAGNCSEALLLL